MTTWDLIIALFYHVDEQLHALPKHPGAHLWPSEVVTLGLLHTLIGVGNRVFHRWLTRDYQPLFPQPGRAEWGWYTEKIRPQHVERLAVVYVWQSTMQQGLEPQESTRLQYGLVQRAVAWGWSEARVLVIDADLGRSGTSAEGRHGFQRLVAEVGLDHVGLILGVEMSRLARSSKDGHQLLEICALFGTLIADLDGLYDPRQYNDRLLLG